MYWRGYNNFYMHRNIRYVFGDSYHHQVVGPVTPLPILPANGPDDLYTIQDNLKLQPNLSAQTQASWAEVDGPSVQSDLAATLDYQSVWYRDHLVH